MFQDLKNSIQHIEKAFKLNPQRSISALYRKYRSMDSYSLIGDFPILATIINTGKRLGIVFTRKQVLYALNKSEELKSYTEHEKTDLVDCLLQHSSVGLKRLDCAS